MSRAGEEYSRFFDKDGRPRTGTPGVVVDVVAAVERAREAMSRRTIIRARFASSCPACVKPIAVGTAIAWQKGGRAVHVACWEGEIVRKGAAA